MKSEVLEQLLHDRATKRQVVVATDLTDGNALLIYPTENDDVNELKTAAKQAMVADKSGVI